MIKKTSDSPKPRPILSDHVRKRRKLIPPFLASMGDRFQPFNWARDIAPEAIWIALLVGRYGMKEGAKLVSSLCSIADKSVADKPAPSFCRFSAFLELTDNERKVVLDNLSLSEITKITRGLYPLQQVCPGNPLGFLFEKADHSSLKNSIHPKIEQPLQELYDRFSKISALSAAVATYSAILQGKLMMPRELLDKVVGDLEAIPNYPDTDAAKSAAGAFRAGAPALFGQFDYQGQPKSHNDWLEMFWKEIGMTGGCVNRFEIEYEEVPDDPFGQLVVGFRNSAKKELSERLKVWAPNLAEVEPHQVVSALLARQVTIALEIADSPGIWTPNTAPTILRCMADVFVILAWTCGDPINRAKQFIEHGLGAIKLEIAQREKALNEAADQDDAHAIRQIIEVQKSWLDAQRMDQLIEVNLGSWAGLTTRKMAEEAGHLDFYNYVYQPFSNSVHSSWAHIGQFNSTLCANPSHRPHWVGTIVEFEPDMHWLYLTAKYLDKTFREFDQFCGISISAPSSFVHVVESLNSWHSDDNNPD